MNDKMLGERLKQLRNENKMTQQELADKLGINRATIAGYETKGVEPSHETLTKIASIYDCSIDYLLGNVKERCTVDKIKSALASDPELANFWDKLLERKDLQLLYKQTKDLSPMAVKQVIGIIKAVDLKKIDE